MAISKATFPLYRIGNINAQKLGNDLLMVDHFKGYLSHNPHLESVHNHTFYHIVYFTQGGGTHLIDFKTVDIVAGMIYFMKPGQVHQWKLTENTDGYILNFDKYFLDSQYINSQILQYFVVFNNNIRENILIVPEEERKWYVSLFEKMIAELMDKKPNYGFMLSSLIIELLSISGRLLQAQHNVAVGIDPRYLFIKRFQELVENNFKTAKFPKDYARLLACTTTHLNNVCKEALGISAGQIIRDRILLEAKRLLITKELSIGEIAVTLNFEDPSYFGRFFKKYEFTSPELFRKTMTEG